VASTLLGGSLELEALEKTISPSVGHEMSRGNGVPRQATKAAIGS